MGASPGLGILPGKVVRFDFGADKIENRKSKIENLKVPHIGWNALSFKPDAPLFRGLDQGDRVYFVHSYYPRPDDDSVITATSDYGAPFCA